jgi:hypothetical protein
MGYWSVEVRAGAVTRTRVCETEDEAITVYRAVSACACAGLYTCACVLANQPCVMSCTEGDLANGVPLIVGCL